MTKEQFDVIYHMLQRGVNFCNRTEELMKSLSGLYESTQWHPIETWDGREGVEVFVWLDDLKLFCIASWTAKKQSWWAYGKGYISPTHWKHYPEPPK